MSKVLTTFVKYPFYSNIVIAVILLVGGYSLLSMKKSFFPERKSRFINVSVTYPGASPKEMEEGITSRIEESIRGLVGIKEITSTSSENFARINIEIKTDYDIDDKLIEVKNAVDGISSFPVDAERPIVFKQREVTRVGNLGLSGDVDLLTLKKYATEIEEDFLNSGVISQVSISGYPPLEISVEATEENLLRYNLTFDDISRVIANNNRDISAGLIRSDDEEILIRSRNRSVDPNIIGDIILRSNADGSYLRIRDIANVKLKFSETSNRSYMNGKLGISFRVNKLAEEDLEEISKYMEEYTVEFNKDHQGVELEVTFDFMVMLTSRLEMLIRNGGMGLLLVVICLALFLSFRLSLWVAWGIPASFLAMFVAANLAGVTINMISLFGMILVIGILVDDGIVIAENIFTHFEKGKSSKRAAIDGTKEVMPAVLTSVTTTMVAFAPLMFLQGQMEMLYEMAFIVVFSLGFSLFEAYFVLPAHLSSPHVLRRKNGEKKSNPVRKALEKVIYQMRDVFYSKVLKAIIKWRWVVITIPIALMIITIGMIRGTIIQTTLFPAITFDFFTVNIAFTPGSGEKQTLRYLEKFEEQIWKVDSELKEEFADSNSFITYVFRSIGSSFNGQEAGAHAGNIFIILRDMEGAPVSSFDIVARVKKEIGEIPESQKLTIGGFNRWGSPVAVSLLGKNLAELDHAKDFMMESLGEIPSLKNLNNNNAEGKQEVRIKLKPEAYFLGLSQTQISNQIRQGFYGGQVQKLQQGKDEIRVWVRYPKEDRLTLGQLESMKIKTAKGEFPLTELVTYHIERGPVNIQRYNASREVRIDADLLNPYDPVPPILEEISNTIIPKMKAQFPGVNVEYQGQQKSSNETFSDLLRLFGIAFLIIVLLLIVHFKSVMHALIILMMIPISYLGSAWGHAIHGHPMSILSLWGMVALSGVIINDAVVFLAKYNSLLQEGYKIEDAAYHAGQARFRAILLTTLTTTLGLFPIIMETSFQAQFLIPMAIALAYGVLFGTGFILVFFPALILTLNDIKYFLKKLFYNEPGLPEDVEVAIKKNKVTID